LEDDAVLLNWMDFGQGIEGIAADLVVVKARQREGKETSTLNHDDRDVVRYCTVAFSHAARRVKIDFKLDPTATRTV